VSVRLSFHRKLPWRDLRRITQRKDALLLWTGQDSLKVALSELPPGTLAMILLYLRELAPQVPLEAAA
jgi:hypothetical protein